MEYRFSNLLTLLTVVFFYSSGQPSFYLLAFFNLLSAYWADKTYILRNLYKSPYLFEGDLILMVQKFANCCLFAHVVGSILVYSNSAIMTGF
jgi:hypothetical protein